MDLLFFLCVLIIAFLYSSSGHGGATAYLAIMAILGFAPDIIKPTALILNLIVSSIAFTLFYKAGYFKFKILLPFAVTSIPMAYLGSQVVISLNAYQVILGILLLIAALRIVYNPVERKTIKPIPYLIAVPIGAMLGFFSGMIGIGGGVILSPILIIAGWAKTKQTAAVVSLFVFLTSASGLVGIWNSGAGLSNEIVLWGLAGIMGGIAGSYLGGYKFPVSYLRIFLSAVLVFASIKLIIF